MPFMSLASRREYLCRMKPRYLKAASTEKTKMLDEYCTSTGLNRKYVIDCLSAKTDVTPNKKTPRKKRRPRYGNTETYYLHKIWEVLDYPCGARLKPVIGEMIAKLRQWNELDVPHAVEEKIVKIAASTIDEKLKRSKREARHKILGTTKPGSLLKRQIPIRTVSWDEKRAGYCELDTVAHCGTSAFGDYANTVDLTDLLTQWSEQEAILGKGQKTTRMALERIKQRLPFALKGIDPDNGGEFINWHLLEWCSQQKIEFTRGRPYQKNDNAHIEQKNWTHVRKLVGYGRIEDPRIINLLNDLYRNEWRLYMNFFQPTMKLVDKKRWGEHHEKIKRIYDQPKTPYQRVLACSDVPEENKQKLRTIYERLNPAQLRRVIIEKRKVLGRAITAEREKK